MNTPHFKVTTNDKHEPHFAFVVENANEGHGENYSSQEMCDKGIASVRENCKNINQYELRTAENGKFYFVLKAKNGEIIYTGKLQKTEIQRERGIELLMQFGPTAEVIRT